MKLPHSQFHDHASTSKQAQTNRKGFVDNDELDMLLKGVVPVSTDKCARWTWTNLATWKKAKSEKHPEDPMIR